MDQYILIMILMIGAGLLGGITILKCSGKVKKAPRKRGAFYD